MTHQAPVQPARNCSVDDYLASLTPTEGLWITGKASPACDGGEYNVIDPASGLVFSSVSDASLADAIAAVDAAARVSAAWAATAPRLRSEVLRQAYELMIAELEPLSQLMARENGKSLPDARAEVRYAAEFFRWYAEEGVRTEGSFGESPDGGSRTVVTHRPVGISALVTPWNFPAAMVTRKVAPALAAGCTVVLKPAAETPLTALAIARLLARAGLPSGALNVIPCLDPGPVVSAWMADTRVRKLSFTGSTGVGRLLLHEAADRIIKTSMELGGNAPFIVTADADVAAAVEGAMLAKFRNGGQACTAANRFYVHSSVVEQFTASFIAGMAGLKVGPADDGCDVGPLITRAAVERVTSLVEAAIRDGATIAYQGETPAGVTGYFYPPTLLQCDASPEATILQTEIFGPVVTLLTWDDEEQLLTDVNESEFGLAAYVYSSDLQRAVRMAERLEVGMVGINRGAISDPAAPFGGLKQSGIGREGAREGMREFQETQYFSVAWD